MLDLRKDLQTIQVDTYVFGGKYDAQCPVEFSEKIAERIPTSDLTILSNPITARLLKKNKRL